MIAEQQTDERENPKMSDVPTIDGPKVGQRRGWWLFLLINALLLAGCLWTVGNYNDWHGDDVLRDGTVITVAERVWTRLIGGLILVVLFGAVFVPLHRWISWTSWIIGALIVLGLIAGLFGGTSYIFGVSAMLAVAFFVAVLAAIYLPSSHRWSFALAMVGITSGTFLANHVSLPRHQRLVEARNANPFVDIRSRLSYEQTVSSDFPGNNEQILLIIPLIQAAELELLSNPERGETPAVFAAHRNRWLKKYHDPEYERFIRAEGFGFSRIVYPNRKTAELPPLLNISLEEKCDFFTFYGGYESYRHSPIDETRTVYTEVQKIEMFHRRSLRDFLNPVTFGFVRSRQVVAGFQPHAFHIPVVPENRADDFPKLEELQLVSLLRFDEPEVYYLDNLPRMDQLSSGDFETRALDNFETMALKRLYYPEEIVVVEDGTTIRMLGAIRASYTCLQCHTVEDGALLGAFSYRFTVPQNR